MMSGASRKAVAFEFRGDFQQPPAEPARICLTGPELAALIGQVRAETLAEVSRGEADMALERVDAALGALRQAGTMLIEILSLIEAAKFEPPVEERVRATLLAAARHLVDGQADLFDAAAGFQTQLDKPGVSG